jgi:hypothetical protein
MADIDQTVLINLDLWYAPRPGLPDGQIAHARHAKIARRVTLSQAWLRRRANQVHCSAVPRSQGGRFAIVTKRGAGCDGRGGFKRRMKLWRTAKSCGPDTPTLVSSFAGLSAERRWQESPVTRARNKP